jgi:hypothetical protein
MLETFPSLGDLALSFFGIKFSGQKFENLKIY